MIVSIGLLQTNRIEQLHVVSFTDWYTDSCGDPDFTTDAPMRIQIYAELTRPVDVEHYHGPDTVDPRIEATEKYTARRNFPVYTNRNMQSRLR